MAEESLSGQTVIVANESRVHRTGVKRSAVETSAVIAHSNMVKEPPLSTEVTTSMRTKSLAAGQNEDAGGQTSTWNGLPPKEGAVAGWTVVMPKMTSRRPYSSQRYLRKKKRVFESEQ